MNGYIYLIRNNINGKIYIGQRYNTRCKGKAVDDNYWGSGILIKKAIDKYGIKNFTKEILYENIESQEKLNELEIKSIKIYNSLAKNKRGYNCAEGGQSCSYPLYGKTEEEKIEIYKRVANSNRGQKRSQKTIENLKKSHTYIPPREYDKIENAFSKKKNNRKKPKGIRKLSEEHKLNISKAKIGKKLNLSDEQRKQYSERTKGSGNSRWIEVDEKIIDQIEKWYMEDKCSMKFIFEKTGLKTGKVKRLLEARGIITGTKNLRKYKNG